MFNTHDFLSGFNFVLYMCTMARLNLLVIINLLIHIISVQSWTGPVAQSE
jgi:hypothetical protein